jgi:hypothetical protein
MNPDRVGSQKRSCNDSVYRSTIHQTVNVTYDVITLPLRYYFYSQPDREAQTLQRFRRSLNNLGSVERFIKHYNDSEKVLNFYF